MRVVGSFIVTAVMYRIDTRTAQASGMVAAQADCSTDTAVVLLAKRAELIGCEIRAIALAVLNRNIRFDR